MWATCRMVCELLLGLVRVDVAQAAIAPSQVLVVYNSPSADSAVVLDAYLTAHPEIPPENVFDLNDATLAGVADVSYADFLDKIRDPIRNYLDQVGDPSAASIISILLIKGVPHRILDTDSATVGDTPLSARDEFNAGDYTAAAVDSELVLLWQNLYLKEYRCQGFSLGSVRVFSPLVCDPRYERRAEAV